MSISKPATVRPKSKYRFFQWVIDYIVPALLPLLLAIVPTLYHYSNNAQMLTLESLYRMLALNTVIAIVVYLICLIFTRFRPFPAAIGAAIFLIFFNIYGILYKFLLHRDVFRLEHYTILPLMLIVAFYGPSSSPG